MKVAFIRPNWSYPASPRERFIHNRIWVPLSLCYCAVILEKEGHEVSIVDSHALRLTPEETVRRVKDCEIIFITSSPLDRWECPNIDLEPFIRQVREILRVNPNICLLGVHGTVKPREIMEMTGAHLLVRGEPETAVKAICQAGEQTDIPGLCTRSGNLIADNGRTLPVELNDLPLPAFHLVPIERYRHVILGKRCAVLEGSRGCPYDCTVCLKTMYGPGYRKKKGEILIREVRHAVEHSGVRSLVFIDLDFCLNREAVIDLCKFLGGNKYGISWTCTTHPDSVDRELLALMKKAGCSLIHYGVESASPRILKKLNRKMDLTKIKAVIENTRAAGIECLCFFMFGIMDETQSEMRQTLAFARELNPDYVSFHVCNPQPSTPAYEEWKHEISEPFPFTFPNYSRKQLESFVRKAWLGFYLRPKKILEMIAKIARHGIRRQLRLFLNYLK